MTSHSQRGVALVVTLIMLSVITVVTVAFLAVSRRERASVGQMSNLTDADLAANDALQRAKAQLVAHVSSTNNLNLLGPDLTFSVNYINRIGYDPSLGEDLRNVNYDYTTSTQALSPAQFLQNVANLFYDPRPPVFVNTNRGTLIGPREFRFFIDLNRNGRFEDTGLFAEVDEGGRPILTNGVMVTRNFIGEPQWIGMLQRPNFPHSSSNRFIARYAYIAWPVGRVLDLNFIHNEVRKLEDPTGYGFFRNQGFGTWEVNLAAFLVDLNTNFWNRPGEQYYFDGITTRSTPVSFRHALELLRYRYDGNVDNLDNINTLFFPNGNIIATDFVDEYGNGPLAIYGQGPRPINPPLDDDIPTRPWPGAASKKLFLSLQDLFDSSKTPSYTNFISRLAQASARTNSYDRYTYHTLISQLGVNSSPEPGRADLTRLIQKISAQDATNFPAEPVGRININYDNIDVGATNFATWPAVKFFTNVANVLLSQLGLNFGITNFGITNIPVAPTNFYSSAVHRLLQVAANIHDSITNSPFPSVFRPQFTVDGSNVVISGYYEDNNANNVNAWVKDNPHGIPFVVGAKKGIPNFNKYVMQTAVEAARKLELHRDSTNSPPNQTNQLFIIGVSNLFGLESWNSYTQAFAGELKMELGSVVTMTLTNQDGLFYQRSGVFGAVSNIPPGQWTGAGFTGTRKIPFPLSFKVPLQTNVIMLTNSVYRIQPPRFEPVGPANPFELSSDVGYPIPAWFLTISNRITYVLSTGGRILDFVHLPRLETVIDVTAQLMGNQGDNTEPSVVASTWVTNRVNNSTSINAPPEGIANQIDISLENKPVSLTEWTDYNNDRSSTTGSTKNKAIDGFRAFFRLSLLHFRTDQIVNSNLTIQAPFSPTRKFYQTTIWQVNDPLVHYMAEDLRDLADNPTPTFIKPFAPPPANFLGQLSDRYKPWRGHPTKDTAGDPNVIYLGVKDPGISKSDDWDFPTNKFPNIGSLGRVHRGTPWQTIYLKSEVASDEAWGKQSLEKLSHPTNDWRLIDVFTVAQHPNASRGQLSINQGGLAAWSAVLSSVNVLSNLPPISVPGSTVIPIFTNLFIEPNSLPLKTMVDGINRVRAQMPGQTFRRLGELLSVPELTVASPFLSQTGEQDVEFGLTDVAYEQIPQQILSLLKVGEGRFVIYAYGQALKPADRSILTSGPFRGMCTNYQITGEVLTRSMVLLEGTAANPKVVTETFNILPVD